MLKKNLDFTLANDKHETALTIAINNNDHEMVSALIEKIEPPKWDIDNFQNVFD
jgi:ankyrin repeat protein